METPSAITVIDKESGKQYTVPIADSSQSRWHGDSDTPSIDIHTSYQFECQIDQESINNLSIFYNEAWLTMPNYNYATRLADELNSLVEEYHSPGLPRSERRAVKRRFNKIYSIFSKYCAKHQINIRVTNTNQQPQS